MFGLHYKLERKTIGLALAIVGIASIGFFYVLTLFIGLGAMTSGSLDVTDSNMAAPLLAKNFGYTATPALPIAQTVRDGFSESLLGSTTVVSQPRRLPTSLTSERLSRNQASCTASSASVREPSMR